MYKILASNTLLVSGTMLLLSFAAMRFTGVQIDPLLPASAALCIGGTAVLDRVGSNETS